MTNKDRKNKVIQRHSEQKTEGQKGQKKRMTKKNPSPSSTPQPTVTDRREVKREGVNSKISFRLVYKLTN